MSSYQEGGVEQAKKLLQNYWEMVADEKRKIASCRRSGLLEDKREGEMRTSRKLILAIFAVAIGGLLGAPFHSFVGG